MGKTKEISMIKTFEEFINEGFWKDGINRAKSGEKRIEDRLPAFFQRKDVYPIKGYDNYFFKIDPLQTSMGIEVYHAPDDVIRWKYIDIEWENDKMVIDNIDRIGEEDLTDEEFVLRDDDDFISAINDELRSLPESVFYNDGEW